MGCCMCCSAICLFCCNEIFLFDITQEEFLQMKKDYFEYDIDDDNILLPITHRKKN